MGWGMSERCIAVRERMLDIGERRIGDMDAAGIDMQILLVTTPGVQLLDAETAIALAAASNDQVSQAVRKHPNRFATLAAVAPQVPQAAAKELERAITSLNLKGAVINSHTNGEYLDDQKFWPIFEAAEALGVPIYIHPNTPPRDMIGPLLARGLDGAIYGFAVECGMHADRVLYAMDYPYQYVPEEVTAMERMPLTDADKKAFFQTNAESVFKLATSG
jgi:5-carboxyvanillate decarboxylase